MNQNNNTFIPNDVPQGVPNTTPGLFPQVDPNAPTGLVPPGVMETQAVQAQATEQTAQVQATEQSGNVFVEAVKADAPAPATNPNVLICSKCGSEMKKESRYCMKCGNLNYSHPDNESMKKYAWQSIKQGYFISGANLDNKQQLTMGKPSESVSNSNPFRTCIITNVILHILMAAVMLFLMNQTYSLLGTNLPVAAIVGTIIGVVIGFIMNYSVQAMYIKAGEPWWSYFVPIYNNYILFKISLGNGWLFLTMFVPIVGMIFALVALYNLGKKFYKSGLLTLFFPFVMIPIIAFDKNTEYSLLARAFSADSSAVDSKGRTKAEKDYGRKKFIITVIVGAVVSVALYFAWPYLQPILEKLYNFVMDYFNELK